MFANTSSIRKERIEKVVCENPFHDHKSQLKKRKQSGLRWRTEGIFLKVDDPLKLYREDRVSNWKRNFTFLCLFMYQIRNLSFTIFLNSRKLLYGMHLFSQSLDKISSAVSGRRSLPVFNCSFLFPTTPQNWNNSKHDFRQQGQAVMR